MSLGGAPSLNYQFLDEGRTWWPEEAISDLDVEHVVAAGHADVMLVHDAPGPPWCVDAVADALAQNDMGWTDRALAYASEHRDRVTRAFLTVQPRLLVHGHYHVGGNATVQIPGADYQTSIWSLHRNGHAANLRFLDLATLDSPI